MLAVTVGKENRLQARRRGYRLSVGPREVLGGAATAWREGVCVKAALLSHVPLIPCMCSVQIWSHSSHFAPC